MSEYLSAARTALDEPGAKWVETGMPSAPGYIQGAAYRLGDNLEKREFETLYKLSKTYAITNFDGILESYVKGGKNTVISGAQHRAESLTFNDDGLSQEILKKIEPEKIQQYADAWSQFRINVRKSLPDLLPPFDSENNFNDQKELSELATQSRISAMGSSNPRTIANAVNRGLLGAAGGNQETVARATQGRDLYSLVRDYPQIKASLVAQGANHHS